MPSTSTMAMPRHRNTAQLHLSGLIGTASHPVKQKIRVTGFFLKIRYIGSLHFGCYYLQYVPASKPSDHAWFEVLEAITLYCTWSDNRYFEGKLFLWNSQQIYPKGKTDPGIGDPDKWGLLYLWIICWKIRTRKWSSHNLIRYPGT